MQHDNTGQNVGHTHDSLDHQEVSILASFLAAKTETDVLQTESKTETDDTSWDTDTQEGTGSTVDASSTMLVHPRICLANQAEEGTGSTAGKGGTEGKGIAVDTSSTVGEITTTHKKDAWEIMAEDQIWCENIHKLLGKAIAGQDIATTREAVTDFVHKNLR